MDGTSSGKLNDKQLLALLPKDLPERGYAANDEAQTLARFNPAGRVVLSVENVWKRYRLGAINHGTLVSDLQSWWARICGKEDPNLRIDQLHKFNAMQSNLCGEPKREGDFWALQAVSFTVREGQILGIIGKNGAGKSTLLKILSRVTTPTLGKVKIRGRVASLLEVGTGFHPELSGRENIFLNGAIHGMNKAEVARKLDEIIAFSEINRFIDTPVKRYSSGMYVRLAFAVAAHLDPDILIVDEVLAVGDLAFQKKCLGKMEEVSHSGKTVLFVSHQLNMVENLCGEALLMQDGWIVKAGEARQVVAGYMKSAISAVENINNLLEVVNRRGNKKIIIRSFTIENVNGEKIDAIFSGMDVVFVIGYRCNVGGVLDNVDIGISFHSILNNQSLSVLYSSYTGRVFKIENQEGAFRCLVRRFPFVEGKYKVGARITVNGYEADWPLDGIGTVDVSCGDFYGTGSSGYGMNSQFLVDGVWSN